MPNTSNINTPKLGMQQDKHEFNLDKGEYSFLLNGTIENFDGSGLPQVQNDGSNVSFVNFPNGYLVIGKKYIQELSRTLYFLVNPQSNQSEIGEVKDCIFTDTTDTESLSSTCTDCINGKELVENTPLEKTTQTPYCSYRTIQNDQCFNFNIANPIDIEYKIFQGKLYIYFTDYLNDRRFLYFDLDSSKNLKIQDRFKIVTGYDSDNCDQPIYSTHIDCNKISYNPLYSTPCVTIEDVEFGGNLKAGAYQVMAAYADSLANPLTKYFPATNPVSIKTKNLTVLTDYVTDKSLLIKVTNLESSDIYTHYNLIVAETVDSFTTFKLVATLPITQETYLYTGAGNNYVDITPNDIFFERPVYNRAKSVTKANDYLFFSRLKENLKLNLQQAASKIKVFWQTKALEEGIYAKSLGTNKYRTFMRDEVYRLGIVFELFGDNDTIVFPLVGPSKGYFQTVYGINVDTTVSANDSITVPSCDNNVVNKKWQSYTVGQIVGSPHQTSTNCDDNNCWEYGDFSYHESTELYPNIPEIWGSLCGQPIRDFKFPDSKVTHIHDGLNGSKDYFSKNMVYPIGLKVDHTSVIAALDWAVDQQFITVEQRAKIKGYRIVRANRVGNKSIVAKGLLYDMWNYSKNDNTYYYPNYPYNDLNDDNFIAPDDTTYDGSNTSDPHPSSFTATGRYTFHSPDVHFTNYSLGNILKLETEEYGKSEGFFNKCEEQPYYRLLSTVARSLCFGAGLAAAVSSITKECRSIEKQTIKTEYIPEISGGSPVNTLTPGILAEATGTSGTSGNINTSIHTIPLITNPTEIPVEPALRFQTPISPVPLLSNKVVTNDCKGTTYQWLSPLHIAGLAGSQPEFSVIMAGVLILSAGISAALYFFSIMLSEINIMTELLMSLTPKNNPFIQYNSIGKYNNYKVVPEAGSKVRLLDTAAYLTPDNQSIEESTGVVKINNWNRESSVFLKTSGTLLTIPTIVDNSRTTMNDATLGYNDLNKRIYKDISSYYGSIKNYVPNQYGNIYNTEYLETNNCSTLLTSSPDACKTYFGGDTFITRFALKRKLPFFIQTRFRQLPEADVQYSLLGNVGFPNYYMDFGEGILDKLSEVDISEILTDPGAFYQDLVGTDDTRMDAKTAKFFYQNGYIHLYNYGIPYFLVESDVNVDLRHGENNKEKDYFPNQQDLPYWLQEKNVPIIEDNYYFYNKTYSKQNKESYLKNLKSDYFKFTLPENVTYDDRLIYTERAGTLNENDNWLISKANNFFDVDATNGKIISIEGIEQDKVLLRTENSTQIFAAYELIKTDTGTLQTGTGGIFDSRPKEFAVTDLGYMGSQHKDMLKTEFGHLFVDAKRGNIFQLGLNGSGIEEISRNGMRNWFKENLPFTIGKYIPSLDIDGMDNSYNGVGISLCFDKRYNRFLLTKLDYKPLLHNIVYDAGKFYIDNGSHTEIEIIETRTCPDGYTMEGDFCTISSRVLADSTGDTTPFLAIEKKAQEYTAEGSVIYNPGFNPNGTGTFTTINHANHLWINNPIGSLTGPMNRCAFWNSFGNEPYNTWVGTTVRIDVPDTKTYYIGMGADNEARIKIGCDTIVSFDPFAMSTNHSFGNPSVTFKIWHIYPVTLNEGINYLKIEGLNYGSIAGFGFEIYDNTAAELIAATSYTDLNILSTSADLIGEEIADFSYTCGDCNEPLYEEDGVYYCLREDTVPVTIEEREIEIIVPDRTEISLFDKNYFQDLSWTISYNLLTKTWVSFHSFTPNFYIDKITNFETGLNSQISHKCSVWSHNLTNKSYQVYYDKLYPFTLEINSESSLATSFLNSINYICDVVRYHNKYDWFRKDNITFNKVVVYNDTQNSGQLLPIIQREDDFSTVGIYPNVVADGIQIEINNSQNTWNFNSFYDAVYSKKNNIPIWLRDANNVNKVLNLKAFDYFRSDLEQPRIRGRMSKVRFTNDKYSNYHFTFFTNQFNQRLSVR